MEHICIHGTVVAITVSVGVFYFSGKSADAIECKFIFKEVHVMDSIQTHAVNDFERVAM